MTREAAGKRRLRVIPHSAFPIPHSALTLVELLIVLAILSILLGSAIPILSPSNEARRLREAARGVNTFLAGAQTRAIETGRPFGVRLRKLSRDTGAIQDNAVSLELRYVEQPPPFSGFDDNSRVLLAQDPSGGLPVPGQFNVRFVTINSATGTDLPPGMALEPLPPIFRLGDRIEVGGIILEFNDIVSSRDANGFYDDDDATIGAAAVDGNERVVSTDTNNGVGQLIRPSYDDEGNRLSVEVFQNTTPQLPYWTEALPYQILRQPTPTSNEPYQLPEGVAIDLRASGIGSDAFYSDDDLNGNGDTSLEGTNNNDPVDFLFSPEGTIERVQFNTGNNNATGGGATGERTASPTTDTLFLLVGLRENAPASNAPDDANFGGPAGQGTEGDVEERKAEINWLNGDSRWVVVGARTGTVLTVENAFVNPQQVAQQTSPIDLTAFPASLTDRRNEEIRRARALAVERASLGGR